MPQAKNRPITVKGLSIQFDADVATGDNQAAKDAAKKMVEAINAYLSDHDIFPDAQPQIYGGDDIGTSDVEIGKPYSDEEAMELSDEIVQQDGEDSFVVFSTDAKLPPSMDSWPESVYAKGKVWDQISSDEDSTTYESEDEQTLRIMDNA